MAAESVEPKVAAEMMRHGDVVIDVREPSEYAEAHVDGAVNIPIGALPGAELPDGPLITTCTGGRRAERAADLLDEMGRTAFWIDGGTEAWEAKQLPVVSGPEPTKRLRDRLGPVVAVAGTVAAKAETVTEKVVDKLKPNR
jgi:rhodanese-related sulfurtransferase